MPALPGGGWTAIYCVRRTGGESRHAAVVVGWDNPRSYSLPGAPVDWITCWSEKQIQELVEGDDWDPRQGAYRRYPLL